MIQDAEFNRIKSEAERRASLSSDDALRTGFLESDQVRQHTPVGDERAKVALVVAAYKAEIARRYVK